MLYQCLLSRWGLLCWVLAIASSGAASEESKGESSPPMFMPFGTLPGYELPVIPFAISGDGLVVVGGAPHVKHSQAVSWTLKDGLVGLGWPSGSDSTAALAVSGNGSVIVGVARIPVSRTEDQYHGFRWSVEDGMQLMPNLPGATSSIAHDVSADGQVIVGNSGPDPNCTMGYRWTEADGMIAVGSLPPNPPFTSQINGISGNGLVLVGDTDLCSDFERSVRWTSSNGMQVIASGPGTSPTAMAASFDGSVIVGTFVWRPGQSASPIPDMSLAHSVSADGTVIVGHEPSAGGLVAKIWTEDCGTRNLNDLLIAAGLEEVEGWELWQIYDIADDNRTIVGVGIAPGSSAPGWGWYDGFLARLPKRGDLNFDGDVDVEDLLKIINSWGSCEPGSCIFLDSNCDGTIGPSDLLAVIQNWDP